MCHREHEVFLTFVNVIFWFAPSSNWAIKLRWTMRKNRVPSEFSLKCKILEGISLGVSPVRRCKLQIPRTYLVHLGPTSKEWAGSRNLPCPHSEGVKEDVRIAKSCSFLLTQKMWSVRAKTNRKTCKVQCIMNANGYFRYFQINIDKLIQVVSNPRFKHSS